MKFFLLLLICAAVAVAAPTDEGTPCFHYEKPLEGNKMLKDLQDECRDKPHSKTCIECKLGLIDSVSKTVQFDKTEAFIKTMVVEKEHQKILIETVEECKKVYEGDDKLDKYLHCWRPKLMEVCKEDKRLIAIPGTD